MDLTAIDGWSWGVARALLVATATFDVLCVGVSGWALRLAVQRRSLRKDAWGPCIVANVSLVGAGVGVIPQAIGFVALGGSRATWLVVCATLLTIATLAVVAFQRHSITVVMSAARYEALADVPFAGDRAERVKQLADAIGLPQPRAYLTPTLKLAALTVLACGLTYGLALAWYT